MAATSPNAIRLPLRASARRKAARSATFAFASRPCDRALAGMLADGQAQCAAPQLAPVPISIPSGTSSVDRGQRGFGHDPLDHRRGGGDVAFGQFEHQFVVDLQQHPHVPEPGVFERGHHPRHRALDDVGAGALDRRVDRGALAARRARCGFFELIRGNHVLRPNSVSE